MNPGADTVLPPDRETWDLIAAYLYGEISEGCLRQCLIKKNGWRGDQTRAAWFDAVERGSKSAEEWLLIWSGGRGNTIEDLQKSSKWNDPGVSESSSRMATGENEGSASAPPRSCGNPGDKTGPDGDGHAP